MRKNTFVFVCLCFALLFGTATASATISLPTAQESLTVYIPPPQTNLEPDAAEIERTPIPAQLNQRMATRSGPSSAYTEELGTVPKTTEIVVLWQEGNGVSWVMVEFSRSGKLYRAYTGMKRIDTDSEVPELAAKGQKAIIVPEIRPYYGPGTQYELVNHTLRGGQIVDICIQERGYALIDYVHPEEATKRARSWVPVSALKGVP